MNEQLAPVAVMTKVRKTYQLDTVAVPVRLVDETGSCAVTLERR